MSQRKKSSPVKSFLITLLFGLLLVGASILSEKAPEKLDNFIEESLNISTTNTSNLISVNTVKSTKPSETEKLSIYYLDVGQGDCELIVDEDTVMLIDAGNNEDGPLLVNYLQGLGITKIDYVVATHPHEDHIGGLDDIINSFEIGNVYMPQVITTTQTYQDLIEAIRNKGLKVNKIEIGEHFTLRNAIATVIYVDNEQNEELNNNSIIINLAYGEKNFLFTGDTQSEVESKIIWDHVDVLKVAHHGSKSSTSEKFLSAVKPEIAIISCGKNNDYGYPHKDVLDRLGKQNVQIYRTDTDGTIILTTDGNTIDITSSVTALDGNPKTNSLEEKSEQE